MTDTRHIEEKIQQDHTGSVYTRKTNNDKKKYIKKKNNKIKKNQEVNKQISNK